MADGQMDAMWFPSLGALEMKCAYRYAVQVYREIDTKFCLSENKDEISLMRQNTTGTVYYQYLVSRRNLFHRSYLSISHS